MAHGADVAQYKKVLMKAAAENDLMILRPYLEQTGNQWEEVRNKDRQHILHVAAMEGASESVKMMLKYQKVSTRVNSRDRSSRTALHLAAAMGFEDMVRDLVAAKASLNMQDDKGCTPLQLAVKFEWTDTVKTLVDLGANPLQPDNEGDTAIDVACFKQDARISEVLESAHGHKPMPSAVQELRRCIFPRWMPRPPPPARSESFRNDDEQPSMEDSPNDDQGCGVGSLDGTPQTAGGRTPTRTPRRGSPDNLCSVLDEAQAKLAENEHEDVIEWHGLEPVLVKKDRALSAEDGVKTPRTSCGGTPTPRGTSPRATPRAATSAAATPLGTPRGTPRATTPTPRGTSKANTPRATTSRPTTPRDKSPRAAALSVASAAAARLGVAFKHSDEEEGREFAIFRLHLSFDEKVKRLEFEVEWGGEQPAAGAVKPGGAAAVRSLHKGDRIVEINGKRTSGKGRDELLPALKERPLLLKVDRSAEVVGGEEPHLELSLPIGGVSAQVMGFDVEWRGELPVVVSVKPQSKAFLAGLLDNDAIVRVDDREVATSTRPALEAALQGAQTVAIWRRPLGMDATAPWHP